MCTNTCARMAHDVRVVALMIDCIDNCDWGKGIFL